MHLKMLLNLTFCHDYRDYLDIMAGVSKPFFSANLNIENTVICFVLVVVVVFLIALNWNLPFVVWKKLQNKFWTYEDLWSHK